MHVLLQAWYHLKDRCDNPSNKNWKNYGGRGIKYSSDWADYKNFYRDMRPTWRKGLVLDRIDNDGAYSTENCRWVTITESNRNRRWTVLSTEKAAEIRKLYLTGQYSQRKLAAIFGTTQQTICQIYHNRIWQASS